MDYEKQIIRANQSETVLVIASIRGNDCKSFTTYADSEAELFEFLLIHVTGSLKKKERKKSFSYHANSKLQSVLSIMLWSSTKHTQTHSLMWNPSVTNICLYSLLVKQEFFKQDCTFHFNNLSCLTFQVPS